MPRSPVPSSRERGGPFDNPMVFIDRLEREVSEVAIHKASDDGGIFAQSSLSGEVHSGTFGHIRALKKLRWTRD